MDLVKTLALAFIQMETMIAHEVSPVQQSPACGRTEYLLVTGDAVSRLNTLKSRAPLDGVIFSGK